MKTFYMLNCEYCKEKSIDPESLFAHEKECILNPTRKSCGTCIFYRVDNFRYPHTNENTPLLFSACLLNMLINPLSGNHNQDCKKYQNVGNYIDPAVMKSILNGYDYKRQLNLAYELYEYILKEEEQESPFSGEGGPDDLPF